MNHECISQIVFEDSYTVPAEQTARALFARLPHGSGYAQHMIDCLATGYLVAVIESICISRMQEHVDPIQEVVVGRRVAIEHRRPLPAGTQLRMRGWVEALGERSVTFRVQANDLSELACEAVVVVVAARRDLMSSRLNAPVRLLVDAAPPSSPALA